MSVFLFKKKNLVDGFDNPSSVIIAILRLSPIIFQMSSKNSSVQEILSRLRQYFQDSNVTRKYSNEPPPFRGELYNTAQIKFHGRKLAMAHKISSERKNNFLLHRLAENENILIEVRNLLSNAVKDENLISPGGEWLLDNFYLIEEQIRTGKRHFPKGYSEGLPYLTEGGSVGLPRVYDIAVEIVSHSDGRIDAENLSNFVAAYQEVAPLDLGELWAIPIMLRLAIIENLRRVSTRIALGCINQSLADYWSDLMIETDEKNPENLILVIADMARSGPPMESSFVAELSRQLMWKGPSLTLPLTWMEQRLSEGGLTTTELVATENQKQAADQLSISNSIGSLRFINATDWRNFVEELSLVEQTLRAYDDVVYSKMDFATRDHYRHAIERISKYSPYNEVEVAQLVIKLTEEQRKQFSIQHRTAHIGYFLIDKGLTETEALAKMKAPFLQRLGAKVKDFLLPIYIGSILMITIVLSGIAVLCGLADQINVWLILLSGVLAILGTSQLAMTLVNWVVTQTTPPDLLPRLDFSEGIPEAYRTLVVVPTMLTSIKGVDALVEDLEIRFLANRQEQLTYGLLTDFSDASQRQMPTDENLLALTVEKINALNEQYAFGKDIFFLFHRPRVWNPYDKVWMGYERKRGKLAQLNELILKGSTKYFSKIEGNIEELKGVKYVITLDTDTLLPREAAWKMIGTMAHPLNTPVYNQQKKRVTDGYAILQPRVAVSLPNKRGSIYNRMHANDAGIDPYTRLTSDVYQDLFKEGSFIGKGIYDVAVFEETLKHRFPENRILSHDLLEGCYARAGLLSDVQLYEEYPSKYSSDVSRRHRWIRGDWQIAWWFLPLVPNDKRKFQPNTLSALSRWKIFDNIRRSLIPIALLLLLLLGWTVLEAPIFYTVAVVCVVVIPTIISACWEAMHIAKHIPLSQHFANAARSLVSNLLHNLYALMCLPYEAYYSVDAIIRTSWRMLVSKKHLLEWTPSSGSERQRSVKLLAVYISMWVCPVLALSMSSLLIVYFPISLFSAGILLLFWIAAPTVTWWISKPPQLKTTTLSDEQLYYLRRMARKTWGYFEAFTTETDNWLPPDNYQEKPKEAVAHRTSPTNIGLSLLANLAAYDFGYIAPAEVLMRTQNTFDTLSQLEKHRGHLYNWYDTLTLQPLLPRYVSTVDSGNFVGHVLTLRQGLIALTSAPVLDKQCFEGLKDILFVLQAYNAEEEHCKEVFTYLQDICNQPKLNLKEYKQHFDWLQKEATIIQDAFQNLADADAIWWAKQLVVQISKLQEELLFIAPWVDLPVSPTPAEIIDWVFVVPTLQSLATMETTALLDVDSMEDIDGLEDNAWRAQMKAAIMVGVERAEQRILQINKLQEYCIELANVDYRFLYDKSKQLLSIGYNVEEHKLDVGSYDLLASEARLCSFVAIAQGKLPQESWFALGKLLTNESGKPILLSWSGSMFEYLMPNLVMPNYEQTLLYQTNKAVVDKQIEFGVQHEVPWGVSECGYNLFDTNLNYQYRAFGVPGLGLKRGLNEDLVIAPYASMMALIVSPNEACSNMQRLSSNGFEGRFGFYEAIDYTPSRVKRSEKFALIQSFMVHHQGMGFLGLVYLLQDRPMQKRFVAELQFQATLLLLQERIPKATAPYSHTSDVDGIVFPEKKIDMRVLTTPHTPTPELQLLSNGRYHTMFTNAGGSYSRWKNVMVTRWREDTTCDNRGIFCYIRDMESGNFWSNTFQPTMIEPQSYIVTFTQGRAEVRTQYNRIECYTEVVVSPEDDIELRRLHITNRSKKPRVIELTSYAEVVLNSEAADNAHTTFSNLFVQTEIVANRNAIICSRRPRSANEQTPWLCHIMKLHGARYDSVAYETDRMAFIGRGHTTANPYALTTNDKLCGNQGSVLDPITAVRYTITLHPDQHIILDMIFGMNDTRAGCETLINKYQDRHHADRVLEMSWTYSQIVLRQINATEEDAQLYNKLASAIIYMNPNLRAPAAVLASNRKNQSDLWKYAISGDLPIILLKIKDRSNILLAKQLIQAHAYWRLKGLAVDLVIWNEDFEGYRQDLQDQILELIAASAGGAVTDLPGGIFTRNTDQIPQDDQILFQTIARVIITDEKGTLASQINKIPIAKTSTPLLKVSLPKWNNKDVLEPNENLLFNNGCGGFTDDGQEYIIHTNNEIGTPAPWVNVIANADFGTVLSENGQAYTWIGNAHEQRLTPWTNDPVSDMAGEHFYIRDEETGHVWSPTSLPAGNGDYQTKHGFGYSSFHHATQGIASEMTVFVALNEPLKFINIKLKNLTLSARSISVTGYVAWVLGSLRHKSIMHIITEREPNSNVIFARNSYNTEFGNKLAFFSAIGNIQHFTCDRTAFIGRNGSPKMPSAMQKEFLTDSCISGVDACAALQSFISLAANEEVEITFLLGAEADKYSALQLLQKYTSKESVAHALADVKHFWAHTLGQIKIETPDAALNLLTNGWLTYQTLSCRLWARSGFYQSGGAFGFRDQLQDVLALLHTQPQIAKAQILLCASRQFKEGDVQHWWHPPSGRGVRTKCSDDYLWLPYVTAKYIQHTSDSEVLNATTTFLEGRLLNGFEESYYDLPMPSNDEADVYTHCVLAIKNGLHFGEHGLPLMGSGDWNDGMDQVGIHGEGESVWLGFFLYDVLRHFEPIARQRGDSVFADLCIAEAERLKENINQHAWDGNWYRRAYFDDGTPLGSSANEECSIDSISQSWSVLSNAGTKERISMAMASLNKHLVDKGNGLIQLLNPPFDKGTLNPGYIKGYVPGVRENGGQYSHAAIWAVMAFAAMGDKEKTWSLLQMINPINHTRTSKAIEQYKTEPYVMAADVYKVPTHLGRGGWTWYTGSAGWMYQAIVQSLLGLNVSANSISFKPCLPEEWSCYKLAYRYGHTVYNIEVVNKKLALPTVVLDEQKLDEPIVKLIDDGLEHSVLVSV